MRLEDIKLSNLSDLYHDYLYNYPKVEKFYKYSPHDEESFTTRYNFLNKQDYSREELASVLREYNINLGCCQATLDSIDVLTERDCVAVVTGQQAGILTGPLYTIYKIITAIKLSKELTIEKGIKAVPIFWLASEDHDFHEINHIYKLVQGKDPVKVSLHYRPNGKYSIGNITMDEEVLKGIKNLINDFFKGEENEWTSALEESAHQSESLAEWCGRLITYLFKNTGLIVIDPMLAGIRSLQREAFKKAIRNHQEINTLFYEETEALINGGYKPVIEKDSQGINLFLYNNGERLPLQANEEGFNLRNQQEVISLETLERLAEESPTSFSPNVVLRPVLQDIMLPTIAYIGGPGEIAYAAQLKKIYPIFNLEMPIFFPRVSITLIPTEIKEILQRYNLSLNELLMGKEELIKKVLNQKDNGLVNNLFSSVKENIINEHQKLTKELVNIDDKMHDLIPGNLARILFQVEYLEKKTWQKVKKQNIEVINDLLRTVNCIYPNQGLQERTFSIFSFISGYPQLIEDLLSAEIKGFDHKLLFQE